MTRVGAAGATMTSQQAVPRLLRCAGLARGSPDSVPKWHGVGVACVRSPVVVEDAMRETLDVT